MGFPPSILCSNHVNSLTDALLLVTTVPRSVSCSLVVVIWEG